MNTISPLDGRYGDRLHHLTQYFSEFALMRARCQVELHYLNALGEPGLFPAFTADERQRIDAALHTFTDDDYQRIKAIENTTKHDVKACEMFLREKLALRNPNLIHFGLTSEDANNLAYNLMLKGYLEQEHLPLLKQVLQKLADLAAQWKTIPFPARTHGQKASPSTAGKELAVFVNRLLRQYHTLKAFKFTGKLNGAVGNFSAMLAAFPDYDWMAFASRLIARLGLLPNLATTQIEDHDTWAEYFNLTRQINNIVLDLDLDCWLYISYDLFQEETKAGEVGSSTMPHKVNPINFENSEGNLMISNALLGLMADKLCRSRMQRDLSDSTVERNMGVALAHAHLALTETLRGLNKLKINAVKCREELEHSPELLAEPIQTILRTMPEIDDPYTLLKQFTRGKTIAYDELMQFVDQLQVDKSMKARLSGLQVTSYIGDAVRICEQVLASAAAELG